MFYKQAFGRIQDARERVATAREPGGRTQWSLLMERDVEPGMLDEFKRTF